MILVQRAFSIALLHFLWQGTTVALLLWILLFFLRKRSPNIRYATCCAAMGLLTMLPPATTLLVYRNAPVSQQAAAPSRVTVLPLPAVAPSPFPGSRRVAISDVLQTWAIRLWCAGVLLVSLRFRLGLNGVATLRMSGQPAAQPILALVDDLIARMGVTQSVQVLVSTLSAGPSVAGWLHPVIFLPVSAVTGLSPLQLEAILAHEIAHIRRHDYLVNLLQIGAETLLFYHPAVWWISARIRQEREYCCDDLAVRGCRSVLCYARALTALEKLRLTSTAPALGSTDGRLLERIQRLLGETAAPSRPSRLGSLLAVALVLVCVVVTTRFARADANRGSEVVNINGAVLAVYGVNVISQTPIDYPEAARSAGRQGLVEIKVFLDSSGWVREARLIPVESSDKRELVSPELQNAALASASKWHFDVRNGARSATVDFLFQASPRSADALMEAGDLLFHAGLLDAALPRYRAGAEAFASRRTDFRRRQLEVYLCQENFAAAKEKLKEMLVENPEDPELLAIRASFLLDEGNAVSEAARELQRAIGVRPQYLFAHYNLGRAYAMQHDARRAQMEFEEVLRLPSDTQWARLARSEVLLLKRDYYGAIEQARQATGGAQFNATAAVLEATALRGLHHYDEARALIGQVLDHAPNRADALAEKHALDFLRNTN